MLLVFLLLVVYVNDVVVALLPTSTYLRHNVANKMTSTLSMEASDTHFDYLVIGGGSGGVASARRAAGYGAKVAIIEKTAMGGTCVNVGCVPKKVMYNAATVSEMLHEAKEFGFDVHGYDFNWGKIKVARDNYVKRLNGIYGRLLGNSKVTVFDGTASFGSKTNEIVVNDKTLTADHILIAVGGKPTIPNLPGAEYCISSDGFFALEKQPSRVAVIGGGYIGVELAGVLNSLGSHTELFTRGPRPLSGFDDLIVDTLLKEMKKQGLIYNNNQSPKEIVKGDDGMLTIKTASGESFGPFEQVLMATGRVPNIEPLKLPKEVELEKRGYIKVDEYQCTTTKGVYALGDVCGKAQLTPVAIAAGRRLADR